MNKNINIVLFGLCLVTTSALANLNVIADLGGEDAAPYFEGINRQDAPVEASVVPQPFASVEEAEATVLPVITPELTPGNVKARSLQLPGIGALFIVGDDDVSHAWLHANAAIVAGMAAVICVMAPWAVALAPSVSYVTASGFVVLAVVRATQGIKIIRYRRNLRRLPRYVMSSTQIPVSRQRLFLGKGFRWQQKHTQRLMDTRRPEVEKYVQSPLLYKIARRLELKTEYTLPWLSQLLRTDSPLNPVRPLPPVGGNPAIHGIERDELDVSMDLRERVGHSLALGTTRVGKTRLAELLITQDIRRGDITIVFDPKGDADLLRRVWAEAHRAGRENELYVFRLGWPDISARYNAVGRFECVSEVAGRISGQLSGEGNSAAFREFAWRFVNIVARALVALGLRPDYQLITRYVNNISELYEIYAHKVIEDRMPVLQRQIINSLQVLTADDVPRNMQGQPNAIKIMAVEMALSFDTGKQLYDPILDGLRSAVHYDRTYFDKIVASLLASA